MSEVHLLTTGVANLASVRAAFERLGAQLVEVRHPDEILAADRLILPGVGAFGAGIASLEASNWIAPLRERWADPERASLAICLGLQLLCQRSEEDPGIEGLGLIEATVTRFQGDELLVPQLGWNAVEPLEGCTLLRAGYAYFANSYKLDVPPAGWHAAMTTHGAPFVAALERQRQLACQFHPELSSTWGAELLARWLERP